MIQSESTHRCSYGGKLYHSTAFLFTRYDNVQDVTILQRENEKSNSQQSK